MGRFTFSITSFLIVVTLLALGFSAYVSQSEWTADLTYTLFLGLLCLATCGAWLVRGSQQRFWLGYAIFGWCYWFVGFDVALTSNRNYQGFGNWGSQSSQSTGPRLFSSDLLDYAETHLTASRKVGAKVMAQWRGGSYYPGTITQISGEQYLVAWDDGSGPQLTSAAQIQALKTHSRVAGHAILGSLAALVGGMLVAGMFEPKVEKPGIEEPRTK